MRWVAGGSTGIWFSILDFSGGSNFSIKAPSLRVLPEYTARSRLERYRRRPICATQALRRDMCRSRYYIRARYKNVFDTSICGAQNEGLGNEEHGIWHGTLTARRCIACASFRRPSELAIRSFVSGRPVTAAIATAECLGKQESYQVRIFGRMARNMIETLTVAFLQQCGKNSTIT